MKISDVKTLATTLFGTFKFPIGNDCKINKIIVEVSGEFTNGSEYYGIILGPTDPPTMSNCYFFQKVATCGAVLAGLTVYKSRFVGDLYHDEVLTETPITYVLVSNQTAESASFKVTLLYEKIINR